MERGIGREERFVIERVTAVVLLRRKVRAWWHSNTQAVKM